MRQSATVVFPIPPSLAMATRGDLVDTRTSTSSARMASRPTTNDTTGGMTCGMTSTGWRLGLKISRKACSKDCSERTFGVELSLDLVHLRRLLSSTRIRILCNSGRDMAYHESVYKTGKFSLDLPHFFCVPVTLEIAFRSRLC